MNELREAATMARNLLQRFNLPKGEGEAEKLAAITLDALNQALAAPRAPEGPDQLAALLRTHPMFLLPEDDTASPTQRQMDEHDRAQRRQRADGLAKWLFEHGVGGVSRALPEPTPAFREAAVRDFIEFIDEARWHNFPVSVKEFRALAETYITTRLGGGMGGGSREANG